MKVAVTVWGKRISPVFDAARTLLVVEVEHGIQRGSAYLHCRCDNTAGIVRTLLDIEVNVLITGAICRDAADSLESAGIALIPFVTGRADHILRNYLSGNSLTGCRMPSANIRKSKG